MTIIQNPCEQYVEDEAIAYSDGSPKGQCRNCGSKWYEHRDTALPEDEKDNLTEIREHQQVVVL